MRGTSSPGERPIHRALSDSHTRPSSSEPSACNRMRRFRILVSSGGSDTSVKGGSQDNLARRKKGIYRFWRLFPVFRLFFAKSGSIFDGAIIQFRSPNKLTSGLVLDRADSTHFGGQPIATGRADRSVGGRMV